MHGFKNFTILQKVSKECISLVGGSFQRKRDIISMKGENKCKNGLRGNFKGTAVLVNNQIGASQNSPE